MVVGFPASASREHDLDLARRASTGDRVAQRVHVHHALFRILGSNRELEDLVQDAFIEIFRALPSFRGDSTLGRWCQTIAVRVAYLAISRRRPPARDAARRLYAALDRIEPKQRVAYALAAIDGKSLAEVAELTDSSLFAVKTRVWRARRELLRRARKDAVLSAYLEEFQGGAA